MYGIKKLRELILELAVRGKLVPQDANDEPASALLKRIQAEKAKLIAEGKIKKDKPLAPITDEEKPFELPQGWEWTRVGYVGHDWGQKTPDADFTYIEVSAIDSQRGIVASPELVKPDNAPSRARKVVKKGTVIYSTIRPYLMNVAVIEEDFLPEPIASTAFAIVHPFCLMPPRYFLCFFRSPVFVRFVESVQMGIAYPAINDGQFFSGVIPLPPIEEQHRIVAKVGELMALCDQLETRHNNAAAAHEKLVSHLLDTLTQSQSTSDFSANWQRIGVHFDILFTTEASIDALKQTLLQLAVMGKLVPQDPNDEPASALLKRIQAEKTKLIAEGKIKKDKPLPPITADEKPFELPNGWVWTRLGEITNFGATEKLGFISDETWVLDLEDIEKDTSKLLQKFRFSERRSLSDKNSFQAGDVLYGKLRPYLNKVVVADEAGVCTTEILPFRCYGPFDSHYFKDALKSSSFINYVNARSYGMKMPRLGTEDGRKACFPLPPLAEQRRIVAKVDELMALCDQLKTRLATANQLQQKLADVMVEQAIA